jgi:hypothetical protein
MNDLFLPGLRSASFPALAAQAAHLLTRTGAKMAALGENPIDLSIIHRFAPGLYIRQCIIPASYGLITKIHKTRHFFVVVQGSGRVLDPTFEFDYKAPFAGITEPGTQRIIKTIEETHWLTFHPTTLTDPVEIEREIIEQPTFGMRAEL